MFLGQRIRQEANLMGEKYETPEMEIYFISDEDIVTASWGDNPVDAGGNGWDD